MFIDKYKVPVMNTRNVLKSEGINFRYISGGSNKYLGVRKTIKVKLKKWKKEVIKYLKEGEEVSRSTIK